MFQYRQVLLRLRQGDSDRDIARSRLKGRPKVAVFRLLAAAQDWLQPGVSLPDDAPIAAIISAPRSASSISLVEPHRAHVERWDYRITRSLIVHPTALALEYVF